MSIGNYVQTIHVWKPEVKNDQIHSVLHGVERIVAGLSQGNFIAFTPKRTYQRARDRWIIFNKQ